MKTHLQILGRSLPLQVPCCVFNITTVKRQWLLGETTMKHRVKHLAGMGQVTQRYHGLVCLVPKMKTLLVLSCPWDSTVIHHLG